MNIPRLCDHVTQGVVIFFLFITITVQIVTVFTRLDENGYLGRYPDRNKILESDPELRSEKVLASFNCYNPCYYVDRVGPDTGCRFKCRFENHASNEQLIQADGLTGFPGSITRKRKGQILFAYWQESTANQPNVRSPSIMKQFNYTFSYRRDGPVVRAKDGYSIFYDELYKRLQTGEFPEPLPYEHKRTNRMASTVISSGGNTPNRRGNVIAALAKAGVEMNHYGRFMHNRDIDLSDPLFDRFNVLPTWGLEFVAGTRRIQKLKMISQHLFHLAFENSDCEWYHTEKAIQSLAAGTIGVYLGHPGVRKFLPHHSTIFVRDFPDAHTLAAYLQNVASNRSLYESYFEWRKKPIPLHLFKLSKEHTIEYQQKVHCQMCALVHHPIPSILGPDKGCIPPILPTTNADHFHIENEREHLNASESKHRTSKRGSIQTRNRNHNLNRN